MTLIERLLAQANKEANELADLLNEAAEALAQPQQEPVPPELFAQQIAAAMRYADAPLTHAQFVTLVLYLKARAS